MRTLRRTPEGWVDEAGNHAVLEPPAWCILTHDIDGPLLDTGFRLQDYTPRDEVPTPFPYGYISVPIVEMLGREVGMVSRSVVERLQEDLAAAQAELAELREIAESLSSLHQYAEEVVA